MKARRSVRKNRYYKGFGITLFLLVLLAFGIIVKGLFFDGYETKNSTSNKEEEVLQKNNQELSLVMVGDNLIHDKIYEAAVVDGGYDFKPMYRLIKEKVRDYDLKYYNQETILGGSELGLSGYPAFNSPYEVGDAMVDAGFNLVSLATNHTLDVGKQAILNSLDYWDSKEDVLAVGSYRSFEQRDKVLIREVNGISYTMLNYTYGTNGISIPDGDEYLVNVWPTSLGNPVDDMDYQAYKKQVLKDIERVRSQVDLLLVAMHWGVEYQFDVSPYQQDMAEFLASSGVDIVIGTHPHVIEPIAWIGNTLVIYSLGNFLSAHEVVNMANRIGLMSSVVVTKNKDGSIDIGKLNNELLFTYYSADYHDFLVVPFSNPLISNYLSDYQKVYEEYREIVRKMDSSVIVEDVFQG